MADTAAVIVPIAAPEVVTATAATTLVAGAAVSAVVPTALSAEVSLKLRTQIEFYFCDANFRRDKFLRAKAGEDADGFVGLDVIATFNRVKTITTDPVALAAALEDSEPLELSEDRLAVRRGKPLPETDDSEARSVVAKAPFPAGATLEQLQAWASTYGVVARLVMRRSRTKEKAFRGSVIIEYATHEGAAALAAAFAATTCVYEGAPVARVEMLKVYYARKKADRESRKAKDATGAGEKKKAAAAAAAAAGGAAGAAAGGAATTGDKSKAPGATAAVTRKRPNRDAAEEAEEDEEAPKAGAEEKGPRAFEKKLTPGVILRLSELGADASIDSLQLFLNSLGELKFAEYDPLARTANARFENAGE